MLQKMEKKVFGNVSNVMVCFYVNVISDYMEDGLDWTCFLWMYELMMSSGLPFKLEVKLGVEAIGGGGPQWAVLTVTVLLQTEAVQVHKGCMHICSCQV